MKKPTDHPFWKVFCEWAEYNKRYKGVDVFRDGADWSPWWFCFRDGIGVGMRAGPIPFPEAAGSST